MDFLTRDFYSGMQITESPLTGTHAVNLRPHPALADEKHSLRVGENNPDHLIAGNWKVFP
eukprot:m.11691 g.11691  ORF g.11691 m.11691 type:complete len:60 (-) comp4469_c0_seq1:2276-2455(-)